MTGSEYARDVQWTSPAAAVGSLLVLELGPDSCVITRLTDADAATAAAGNE